MELGREHLEQVRVEEVVAEAVDDGDFQNFGRMFSRSSQVPLFRALAQLNRFAPTLV
ncbi:hypothetical protein STHU_40660 [Allostella humosa]|uniref:hypothetical protein n=1 Tax=Stella humosa TaxID=94 RepID=UPI00113E46CE|nr:hypothetical protein [Stella humosa]BBK33432.1 hypothetical protein STHU_40660 [Stella humosa]